MGLYIPDVVPGKAASTEGEVFICRMEKAAVEELGWMPGAVVVAPSPGPWEGGGHYGRIK